MKLVTIKGELRKELGKKNATNIRKKNQIPCVIYGNGENVHFFVDSVLFDKIIYSPEVYFVELELEGKKIKSIIQQLQFHPVTDKTIHVDFMEVLDNKPIVIELPVITKGNSQGVLQGGKLSMVTRKLKVKGLAIAMPDSIECDITKLDIGDSIKVKDIKVDGLVFMNGPDSVVLAVKMSRVALSSDLEEEEDKNEEVTKTEEKKGEKAES